MAIRIAFRMLQDHPIGDYWKAGMTGAGHPYPDSERARLEASINTLPYIEDWIEEIPKDDLEKVLFAHLDLKGRIIRDLREEIATLKAASAP